VRVVITNATSDLGAATARALRLAGFEVHGTDGRRVPRFMVSQYLHSYTCIDAEDPLRRQQNTLEFLRQVQPTVFLPLCTRGAVTAVQCREQLEAICRINSPCAEAFLAAYDKRLCMQQCAALGIPCAGSLTRAEAAALLLREHPTGVIVKPAIDVGAARGLHHATNVEQLDAAIRRCNADHGNYVIQEYIPGADDTLRMVTVVYGSHGHLVGAFTARKLRQWPPGGGVTAYGVSTRDDRLLDLVRPFFDRCRWRGPAEVELKHDYRDDTFKVIEINPRLPGYTRHASLCGVELAVLAARAALGEQPGGAAGLSMYREGVVYLAPTVYLKTVFKDARTRGWTRAVARGCLDVATAGKMLHALITEPLPIVTRSLVKNRPCRPMPFDRTPAADDERPQPRH
jgi:D-aspartate ligase